jgi:hypothetical protein
MSSNAENDQRAGSEIKVDSFDELMEHEKEILARIESMPNGGQLFLIHPFMLLQDIGVKLSERAEQEIRQHEPHLTGLSTIPYQALKSSKEQQNVSFHLRGLFKR